MLALGWTASLTKAALAFETFSYGAIRDGVLDGDVESLSVSVLIIKCPFTFYVTKA